ncbi:MAG TPA: AAA family ATPase [Gemmatimonadales bacterium]|jgi:DNA-binding SARP family transcriptional activator
MADLRLLEIHCFGAPTIRVDGKPAPAQVLWHKHLALLVYLALSPERTRSRAHLLGLLWPERPEGLARQSLNGAVRRLRSELGPARLRSEGRNLTLAGEALDVDVLRFEALVDRRPAAAATCLTGDFLESFALDDARAFDEWTDQQRERYRLRGAAAWTAAGEDALNAAQPAAAVDAATHALALQPDGEPAVRLMMRALASTGDGTGARAAFKRFADRLQEIDTSPSRDLAALAERIGQQPVRRSPGRQPESKPPLVGRERVHREVFTAVSEALDQGGRARAVLIAGDVGSGKTRLLNECIERLTVGGAIITTARPLESDRDTPWTMLRSLLRGLQRAPGRAAADPNALAVLDALTPASSDHAGVTDALSSLLHAIADEQPIGVGVYDAHLSDDASLETLGAALERSPADGICLILTSLTTLEQMPRSLLWLRREIGHRIPGAAVTLEPLTEAETRQLVAAQSAWCPSEDARNRLARRIYFETHGNPFLIVTLLRALAAATTLRAEALAWPPPGGTGDSPLPISVPNLARRAISTWVAELNPESRSVLQAASIGPATIDLDLVATLTGLTCARVEDILAQLERRRFIACDGERFAIIAPLVADVVAHEWLVPGERRNLRARALEALASRTDPEALRFSEKLRSLR